MNEPLFIGVCTALVTPFLDGKINYPMTEMLIRRQIDAGVQTIVIAGTTGESPTLSDNEKIELFRRCKEYVGDDCKIIAGTGTNSTAHAVELSISAEQTGVDGLLVVTPYYNKATEEGLWAHYLAIAHSVSIPVIPYNVPTRTGVDIPLSVYKRLARIPNINGVKEASSSITKITKIQNSCTESLHIWTGNDDMTVPVIALGGLGVISVLSNILPEETLVMTGAALSGDMKTAAHMQCRLQPLIDLLFAEVNPVPVKTAMKLIGYDCGSCRLPLTELSSENTAKLKALLS